MFHPTAALPDGLRDVRPRLLLCQDLPAAPDIRPVRPVCGPGEAGRLHHNLQGLLRPGHADGQSHSLTVSQSRSLTVSQSHSPDISLSIFTCRTSVSSPRPVWSIVGAPPEISVTSQVSRHYITTSCGQFYLLTFYYDSFYTGWYLYI